MGRLSGRDLTLGLAAGLAAASVASRLRAGSRAKTNATAEELRALFPPGQPLLLNPLDRLNYTSGYCHALAFELRNCLGGTLHAVEDRTSSELRHIVYGSDDGEWLVDAHGGMTVNTLLARCLREWAAEARSNGAPSEARAAESQAKRVEASKTPVWSTKILAVGTVEDEDIDAYMSDDRFPWVDVEEPMEAGSALEAIDARLGRS